MSLAALIAGLRMAPVLDELSDEDLAFLAEDTHRKVTSRGQVLVNHGDEVTHIYVIVDGWAKLTRTTLDGEEAVLDVAGPARMLGHKDLFAGSPASSSITMVRDGEVLVIPAATLTNLLERKPTLALTFLRHVSQRKNQLELELEGRTVQNASQRLGCFLLGMVPDNIQTPDAAVTIHLPFDKALLASRLGMKPETFSRALASLKKDLNLNVQGSSIFLPRLEALVTYTCSACSNNWLCKDRCPQGC